MSSLRLDKLFHVLVILGGATGVAACEDDDTSSRDRTPDAAPTVDAGPPEGDAAGAPDGNGALPCFCDTQECCDRSTDPPVVEDGFACCWSTTCE